MSLEDGVFDQEVIEACRARLEAVIQNGPLPILHLKQEAALENPRLAAEQIEELVQRALRTSNWRQRLLGHPRARLFIHRDFLVTTYPDGRMRFSGPRRAS